MLRSISGRFVVILEQWNSRKGRRGTAVVFLDNATASIRFGAKLQFNDSVYCKF